MTLDLAKGSLGSGVVWRHGTSEERTGTITFTGGESAFVLFEGAHFSVATDPADLELLAGKVTGDSALGRASYRHSVRHVLDCRHG